jgi:hypothetical protein
MRLNYHTIEALAKLKLPLQQLPLTFLFSESAHDDFLGLKTYPTTIGLIHHKFT